MNSNFWRTLFFFILIFTAEILGKRGGGGGGFGRGGFGGSRGSSAARGSSAKSGGGGGGWFGGGSKSSSGSGHYSGKSGGYHGGGGGGFYRSNYREKGLGSRSRSDMFKNMIVGAAAGYLTYQAGKAIIRSMSAPMTWNNRDYYWGSQYYPGGTHHSDRTMCRMPVEPDDPKFGKVYTPDGSQPKEIVWSCPYNEECCGYECCPGRGSSGGFGYGSRYWNSGPGLGFGTIILILLLLCCLFFIIKAVYDKRKNNMGNANLQNNKGEYQRANVNYEENAQPPVAPPPYPAAPEYPVHIGFKYPPA
uniref:CX domain-containing protein n=1 Tax=Meloidogyne javanica TaxID=6303 RepID=A0A915N0D2_MELJA